MSIKHRPEDFIVEEVLDAGLPVRSAPGPYALYRLTKQGIDTHAALGLVARALGVPAGAVTPAGLKDKHARTVQHISVNLSPPGPARASGENWQAERLGWLENALTPAAIAANRFRVVVGGMTRRDAALMDEAAQLLAAAAPGPAPAQDEPAPPAPAAPAPAAGPATPRAIRVVNYFGGQRFGGARHGKGFLAKCLMRDDFEGALKLAIATPSRSDNPKLRSFVRALAAHWGRWDEALKVLPRHPHRAPVEQLARNPGDFVAAFTALPYFVQQINVEAYQSHLWNATARQMILDRCEEGAPMIAADDPFGELLFPSAQALPAELVDLELPLFTRSTKPAEPWQAAAGKVLEAEGISMRDLHIPRIRRPFFGRAQRRFLVRVDNLTLGPLTAEDTGGPPDRRRFRRPVSFDLPRGAYATVVLRALGQ